MASTTTGEKFLIRPGALNHDQRPHQDEKEDSERERKKQCRHYAEQDPIKVNHAVRGAKTRGIRTER